MDDVVADDVICDCVSESDCLRGACEPEGDGAYEKLRGDCGGGSDEEMCVDLLWAEERMFCEEPSEGRAAWEGGMVSASGFLEGDVFDEDGGGGVDFEVCVCCDDGWDHCVESEVVVEIEVCCDWVRFEGGERAAVVVRADWGIGAGAGAHLCYAVFWTRELWARVRSIYGVRRRQI